jgi:hypothetical protein
VHAGQILADKARLEHHKVKEQLTRMEALASKGPKAEFDSAFDALMHDLNEHMRTEEETDLVMIKHKCALEDRIHQGHKFMNRKKIAPTRPHTTAPESPALLEEVMGLFMAPVDKFRDLFRDFPHDTLATQ